MARKSTKRRNKPKGRQERLLMIVMIIGFISLAAYYFVTGSDPLGLFSSPTSTPSIIVAPPGSGGDWWQVYFTNPSLDDSVVNLDSSPARYLITRIQQAKHSIDIAAFEFNLTPVAEALIAAHERGVDVRWVTDDEHGIEADEEEGHGQFAMLEDAGIEIKDDRRGALMHNKFWIFDRQTVWTGSTNITINGMLKNNNNVIIIESAALAAIYEREFDEMWEGEFGPTSPSTVDDQTTTISDTPVQVLFAAEDKVSSHLVPLIQGAQKSIRFMAFSFTHDEMGEALLARAKAGVDVKGIFETRGSETEYSELPRLYCAGVPVRQDGNPRTFHHKVFVIDDKLVVTGSFNFSNNADKSNDENVIILTHNDIAAQYLLEFDRRWAEASEPDPADMDCP